MGKRNRNEKSVKKLPSRKRGGIYKLWSIKARLLWKFEGCSQKVILSSFLLGVERMSQSEAGQRLLEFNFTLF